MSELDISRLIGFDWDEANAGKIWSKHRVSPFECEQIFFNQPLIVAFDEDHSRTELRLYALGRTDAGRRLYSVFTIRKESIRLISARDMDRAEKEVYDNHDEQNP